ncbi:MAG: NADH-quinone oxidoreductase subunit N, partial [Bacteroidia bacterium]
VTILYKVFSQVSDIWGTILLVTSVLTMTVGNLFALRQENMKRFLAFSSIAQAGYILLGILGSSVMGMTSVVYFILIYIFSNLAAFGVISSISAATGKENLGEIRGLYRTNPKLSILLLLAMFSLAGVPPTAGFFGKFFLLTAAAGQGHFVLVTIAALNMIISLYYYLRVVKTIFIDTAESPLPAIQSSFYSNVSFIICGAGIIATGFIGDIYEFFHSLSFGL